MCWSLFLIKLKTCDFIKHYKRRFLGKLTLLLNIRPSKYQHTFFNAKSRQYALVAYTEKGQI